MVFSSTTFLLAFLPALLIFYYAPFGKSRKYRNMVLLLFSIGFYAWGEPTFVLIMLLSVIVNWFIGLLVSETAAHKKLWLTVAVSYNIALLAVFKYATFLSKNLAQLVGNDKLIIQIALPIGISFFTFQLMSYVFDVYYGRAAAQKNPLNVALYISLFPQLIAGPIVRYEQVAADIENREETFSDIMAGTERFIYGLGKKVLLANYAGYIADAVFAADERSVATAWLGAVAYTLQIYFDFSGYSDMAIGLGRMFGFHFSENFNYPYMARSVTEFWRRWHISLSTWFRDYVYIPLGGNRVEKKRWVWNMFVVWLLTGIWHGANWTFLCWGLIYFTVLVVERLSGWPRNQGGLSRIYTMVVVVFAWVIFRADSLGAGIVYLGNMLGIHSAKVVDGYFFSLIRSFYLVLVASVLLSAPLYPKLCAYTVSRSKMANETLRGVMCLIIFSLSMIQVIGLSYQPFIYFNF